MIVLNLILASLIILDLCLPGKEGDVQKLHFFYSMMTNTATSQKPTVEKRNMVELQNGESYRIAMAPDKDYEEGQKIRIVKSALFDNVNEIRIESNGWQKIYVGLFSNTIMLLLFISAIGISILNRYWSNKATNIALVAATMFMAIVFTLYIVYY